MDCVLYLEATVATSGKRIILYVPVEYQEKLRPFHGARLRLIAIIEGDACRDARSGGGEQPAA